MSIHILPPSQTKVEIEAAYERIDELTGALKGMLGLVVLVCGRNDISAELREMFNTNHRIAAAHDALVEQVAS